MSPDVYEDLRRTAEGMLRHESRSELEPGDLVALALARILESDLAEQAAADPRSVVPLIVSTMRRELIEQGRSRARRCRCASEQAAEDPLEEGPTLDLDVDVRVAFERLAEEQPERVRAVAMFAEGGTLREIEAATGHPRETVNRWCHQFAEWLRVQFRPQRPRSEAA